MIEYIIDSNKTLALIIRNSFQKDGIHFFTPNDFSQQLASIHHQKGKIIPAHIHNPVERNVVITQEVLFIKKGVLRVDMYTESQQYIESRILYAGDVMLFAAGGHGFEVIEEVQMIEVKQGPYTGELDKTRFNSVAASHITIKETCI